MSQHIYGCQRTILGQSLPSTLFETTSLLSLLTENVKLAGPQISTDSPSSVSHLATGGLQLQT